VAPAVVYIAAVAPVASVADKPDEQSPAGRKAVIRGFSPVAELSAAYKRFELAHKRFETARMWFELAQLAGIAVVPPVAVLPAARLAHVSLCRTPYRTSRRRPERLRSIYRI